MTSGPVHVRAWLVVTALLAIASIVAYSSDTPTALWLALIPLVYTVPIFMWLDHLEPEPLAMRWNAFLWGAGVSVLVASFVNEVFAAGFGIAAAAVLSAPLVEEIMKMRGVTYAAKRNQIDSPLDGAVYAGYVGLGFGAHRVVLRVDASTATPATRRGRRGAFTAASACVLPQSFAARARGLR